MSAVLHLALLLTLEGQSSSGHVFTSDDGMVTGSLPCPPRPESRPKVLGNGETATVYSFTCGAPDFFAAVTYYDLPSPDMDTKTLLDRLRDGAIGNVKGGATLKSEKDVTVAGRLGREFEASGPDDKVLVARILLDRDQPKMRFIMATYATRTSNRTSPVLRAFLESVTLKPRPSASPLGPESQSPSIEGLGEQIAQLERELAAQASILSPQAVARKRDEIRRKQRERDDAVARLAQDGRAAAGTTALAGDAGTSGQAKTLTVAGRTFKVPVPDGMCFFDEDFPWDHRELDDQRRVDAKNLTLAGMADCSDLSAIRVGGIPHLRRFGQVKSPLPNFDNRPIALSRKELMEATYDAMRKQLASGTREGVEHLMTRLREMQATVKLEQPTNVGIAYHDPDMCGWVGSIVVTKGAERVNRVAVIGMTLINGIPISINLYEDYQGAEQLPRMIQQSRATLTALLSANAGRDPASRGPAPR
jgi:hypothetical protein